MDKLPEELLSTVIKEVAQFDLPSVARVNRKISRITTPFLYSHCVFSELNGNHRRRSLSLLLRTLLANHQHRTLIRHVHTGDLTAHELDLSNSNDNVEVATLSILDLSTLVQSTPVLGSSPFAFQSRLGIGLLQSSQDAMTAAILSLLSNNLESLSLDVDYRSRHRGKINPPYISYSDFNTTITIALIELSMPPSLQSFQMFDQVKDLTISGQLWDGELDTSGWDFRLMSVFMRLPALQTFTGSGCRDIGNNDSWICGDGESTATDVKIFDCSIGTDSMRKVLRSARALRSFECLRYCKLCVNNMSDTISPEHSYASVHRDLIRHRDSLQKLRLGSKSCSCPAVKSFLEDQPIGDLQALENLAYLEMDEDVLIGNQSLDDLDIAELLPPNLERIVIRGEYRRPQHDLFRKIGQALLANSMLPAIDVVGGRIKDARTSVEDIPGVGVEHMSDEDWKGVSNFLFYKLEEEEPQ